MRYLAQAFLHHVEKPLYYKQFSTFILHFLEGEKMTLTSQLPSYFLIRGNYRISSAISRPLWSFFFFCFFMILHCGSTVLSDRYLVVKGQIVSHLIFFILKRTEGGAAVDFIITLFIKQSKT